MPTVTGYLQTDSTYIYNLFNFSKFVNNLDWDLFLTNPETQIGSHANVMTVVLQIGTTNT